MSSHHVQPNSPKATSSAPDNQSTDTDGEESEGSDTKQPGPSYLVPRIPPSTSSDSDDELDDCERRPIVPHNSIERHQCKMGGQGTLAHVDPDHFVSMVMRRAEEETTGLASHSKDFYGTPPAHPRASIIKNANSGSSETGQASPSNDDRRRESRKNKSVRFQEPILPDKHSHHGNIDEYLLKEVMALGLADHAETPNCSPGVSATVNGPRHAAELAASQVTEELMRLFLPSSTDKIQLTAGSSRSQSVAKTDLTKEKETGMYRSYAQGLASGKTRDFSPKNTSLAHSSKVASGGNMASDESLRGPHNTGKDKESMAAWLESITQNAIKHVTGSSKKQVTELESVSMIKELDKRSNTLDDENSHLRDVLTSDALVTSAIRSAVAGEQKHVKAMNTDQSSGSRDNRSPSEEEKKNSADQVATKNSTRKSCSATYETKDPVGRDQMDNMFTKITNNLSLRELQLKEKALVLLRDLVKNTTMKHEMKMVKAGMADMAYDVVLSNENILVRHYIRASYEDLVRDVEYERLWPVHNSRDSDARVRIDLQLQEQVLGDVTARPSNEMTKSTEKVQAVKGSDDKGDTRKSGKLAPQNIYQSAMILPSTRTPQQSENISNAGYEKQVAQEANSFGNTDYAKPGPSGCHSTSVASTSRSCKDKGTEKKDHSVKSGGSMVNHGESRAYYSIEDYMNEKQLCEKSGNIEMKNREKVYRGRTEEDLLREDSQPSTSDSMTDEFNAPSSSKKQAQLYTPLDGLSDHSNLSWSELEDENNLKDELDSLASLFSAALGSPQLASSSGSSGFRRSPQRRSESRNSVGYLNTEEDEPQPSTSKAVPKPKHKKKDNPKESNSQGRLQKIKSFFSGKKRDSPMSTTTQKDCTKEDQMKNFMTVSPPTMHKSFQLFTYLPTIKEEVKEHLFETQPDLLPDSSSSEEMSKDTKGSSFPFK